MAVSSTSTFRQALAYQYSLRMKVKGQIQKAIGIMQGSGDGAASAPDAPRVRPMQSSNGSGGSSSMQSQASRARRAQASSKSGNQSVSRPQSDVKRRRNVSSNRNRKAIANTQADKHGSEAAAMTSLATRSIDGKGLRLNRVR